MNTAATQRMTRRLTGCRSSCSDNTYLSVSGRCFRQRASRGLGGEMPNATIAPSLQSKRMSDTLRLVSSTSSCQLESAERIKGLSCLHTRPHATFRLRSCSMHAAAGLTEAVSPERPRFSTKVANHSEGRNCASGGTCLETQELPPPDASLWHGEQCPPPVRGCQIGPTCNHQERRPHGIKKARLGQWNLECFT
jgi:hypothetical protein